MAKTLNKAARIIFGNKEKKQFPDPEGLEREKPSSAIEGSTQPISFETRLRAKFSEQANEIGIETRHKEEMKTKGMRQTFAKRSSVRPKHLQHPAPIQGGHYKQTPQMEKPHYEEYEKMENKTFTQFVTEAKRGRPRKLKPGEQADTEHLQDQLSKLTHANHVTVHFKNGEKHEIPRAHANKALIHLSGLKPIHRADHVEHMHSSKENFYHTLSTKSIPSKKKSITLAGPKLRKEEVEQIDEAGMALSADHKTAIASHIKKMWGKGKVTFDKQNGMHTVSHSDGIQTHVHSIRIKGGKAQVTHFMDMDEEVEQLDEIGDTAAGKKALGRVALARMHDTGELRKRAGFADAKDKSNDRRDNTTKANKAENKVRNAVARLSDPDYYKQGKFKKEETERPKQNTKTDVDVRKHTRLAADALGRAQSLGRGHKDYDKHMAEYARHRKMALGEEVEQIDELTGKKKKPFGKDPLSAVANRAINRMKLPPNDGSKLSPEEIASNNKNSKVSRMAFDRMEEEVELDEAETLDSWTNKHEKAGRHITKDNKNARYHAWDKDENDRFVNHHSSFSLKKSASNKMEEVESDEKKKTAHHKLLQKFKHRIDEVKAIKGAHASKQHAAKVINPGKVGYAGKGTKPKVQSLRREDYAPLEDGEKQTHVDQKTANAKSRVQGGEKPKKPKMELSKEAWELYDSLSGTHKAVFENMDSAERDHLVDKYISGKR